jgi:FMN phosphatase YigB (HAD superfamily)
MISEARKVRGVKHTPKAIIFDYGGVVADHHQLPAEADLASLLQVSRHQLRELLSEKSLQGAAFRRAEIGESEFWSTVRRLAGSEGSDIATMTKLWSLTYALNPDMVRVLRILTPYVQVGVLTNIDCGRSRYVKPLLASVSPAIRYFPSFRFGVTKPDTRLFEEVAQVLGPERTQASRLLYVDDRQEHVDAALTVGWTGLLFRDHRQLWRSLRLEVPRLPETLPT